MKRIKVLKVVVCCSVALSSLAKTAMADHAEVICLPNEKDLQEPVLFKKADATKPEDPGFGLQFIYGGSAFVKQVVKDSRQGDTDVYKAGDLKDMISSLIVDMNEANETKVKDADVRINLLYASLHALSIPSSVDYDQKKYRNYLKDAENNLVKDMDNILKKVLADKTKYYDYVETPVVCKNPNAPGGDSCPKCSLCSTCYSNCLSGGGDPSACATKYSYCTSHCSTCTGNDCTGF